MLQSAASSPNLPVRDISANNVAPKMVPFGMKEVAFVENQGQFDPQVRYVVKSGNKTIWLTDIGLVFDVLRIKEGASSSQQSVNNMTPVPAKMANDLQERQFERLVFKEQFDGANAKPTFEARGQLPGKYNYFTGSDPKAWKTNVASYSEVIYKDVWPGVDVLFKSAGADIEQQFLVHPGADPRLVKVRYEGIDKLEVASDGALLIHTQFGSLRETPPSIYQEVGGQRHTVQGKFNLVSKVAYAFDINKFRPDAELVIDPTLQYSTYLGGNGGDHGYSIAADASGAAYVTGLTLSLSNNFPTTVGSFQTSPNNGTSFVTKLSPSSGQLVYSSLFGGGSAHALGITVNAAGEAYVTGEYAQNDFPITEHAYQKTCNGSGFLTIFNAAGDALKYSTCFGNAGSGAAIALDSSGDVYIVGHILTGGDIPVTPNAIQTTTAGRNDAFLMVLKPKLSDKAGSSCTPPDCTCPAGGVWPNCYVLVAGGGHAEDPSLNFELFYSTYFGGGGHDGARSVAVDASGNAYIGGWTNSSDFPVTSNALQKDYRTGTCYGGVNYPCGLAFFSKINPHLNGSAGLVYSSFLSGSTTGYGDAINAIAVDDSGNAYVAGGVVGPDFPTTSGAFESAGGGGFVAKINPTGSALVYSTFINGDTHIQGITVDLDGNAYITGYSRGESFPTTSDAFQKSNRPGGGYGYDAFLTVLNASGSGLAYSTYIGGSEDDIGNAIAVDASGDVYLTGYTPSFDFPTTPGVQQTAWGGGTNPGWGTPNPDAFVAKFAFGSATGPLEISPSHGGNAGTVTVNIYGSGLSSADTVKLTSFGQPDIIATNVTAAAHIRISASFDLRGAIPGQYSLVVTRPDNTSRTVAQPFTVEPGGASDIWLDIVGWNNLRGGNPQPYYLICSNKGNLDSGRVRLWVSFPTFLAFNTSNAFPPGSQGSIGDREFLAFDVVVKAGDSQVIPLQLTAPSTPDFAHRPFEIKFWKERR